MVDVRKFLEYLNFNNQIQSDNNKYSSWNNKIENFLSSLKFLEAERHEVKRREATLLRSFIRSFSVLLHLVILNLILYVLTYETYQNVVLALCCNIFWVFLLVSTSFYSLHGKVNFQTGFNKFIKYYLVFCLFYFTLLGFAALPFQASYHLEVLGILLLSFLLNRKLFFILKKTYQLEPSKLFNVVVIGKDYQFEKLRKVFQDNRHYRLLGYFQDEEEASNFYLGNFKDIYDYIKSNPVHEIYCTLSQLSDADLKKIIHFADNNFKKIKLIPDYKGVFTRAMVTQNFDMISLVEVRKSPLDKSYAKFGKRCFDLIFSTIVIVLVLSWLVPLLYLINFFVSRGPVMFKQLRHGHNKKSFWCYKFRSMTVNNEADTQMCTRNDVRITKIGRFLRKTSIDELPQFFNVFLGDMSVVGPRPHMEAHTLQYQENVDKYLVRHLTKPGITGLAQVKGYRGEIIHKSDIINRTRLDIFYLEKWSPLLDVKIIFETVYNSIKGEEKAY